jgi:adenylate cyclase class 2
MTITKKIIHTRNSNHSRKYNNKHKRKTPAKTPAKTEIEFEGRILNIDPAELQKKLRMIGGYRKSPLTLYRRSVFNLCDIKRGFVRVRDEGDKITMTAKIYKNPDFPEEYELNLDQGKTFENGQEFLRALNLTEKAYHETIREKWSIPRRNGTELCEVAIDYIPGLPVYAELECKSERDLKRVCKMLNVQYKDLTFGGYGKVYVEYYGMAENDINNIIPKLTFQNIKSEISKYIHKNTEILDKAFTDNMTIKAKGKGKR